MRHWYVHDGGERRVVRVRVHLRPHVHHRRLLHVAFLQQVDLVCFVFAEHVLGDRAGLCKEEVEGEQSRQEITLIDSENVEVTEKKLGAE